jgi:hypothetical protein
LATLEGIILTILADRIAASHGGPRRVFSDKLRKSVFQS